VSKIVHGSVWMAAVLGVCLSVTVGVSTQTGGPVVGPPSGTLVVVGGAMRDPAILERFVRLAGGPDSPIVVIPTAGGAETYDQSYPGLQAFRDAGATDLVVLHTTDRDVADSEAFVSPLRRARGVWFPGGRQWRLADAYLDTEVHEALRDVLRRGGVVGGSSAGATILGSYLARGDSATNTTAPMAASRPTSMITAQECMAIPPISQNTMDWEREASTVALMRRMRAAAKVLKITPTRICV